MSDISPKPSILTQVPRDSRDHSASSASRAGHLEDAVLASAIGRVRAAALISGVVWTLALLANVVFRKQSGQELPLPGAAGWPMPNVVYAAVGALGSFILADVIGRFKAKARVVLDLGLGLEIFTAALVALCASYRVEPHMARISWLTW